MSRLDQKYFVDTDRYNCPYCNRRNVMYNVVESFEFDWTRDRKCHGFIVHCTSCNNNSMHLSYEPFNTVFHDGGDIDSLIFHSQPTSFFVLDKRIPKVIRELVSEAEGCLKMNYLTGAAACARKAVYELIVWEKVAEAAPDYKGKIKALKVKLPRVDPRLFDALSHIQGLASDKVHEQSRDVWTSANIQLVLETLRGVLTELYVVPDEKEGRYNRIKGLLEAVKGKKPAGDNPGT